ncbi:transmembrane protein 132C isoform X1 [Erpetoichthys calabaricus]|uniref:Transmembrane protein 132C n=1 Tax=Erpetoichthys calabaricus TaxID=27687 RepID=A0A8C4TD60_ERPCA|nr:transmembrane protein 132C isoform X1 [Erpetoichthys calabaricus]
MEKFVFSLGWVRHLFVAVNLLLTTVVGRGVESKSIADNQQRFSSLPTYLPVTYQIQNADSSFFLKEAGQELMKNSSLQSRTEPFFIHLAQSVPIVNSSYNNISVEASVPLEMLQSSQRLLGDSSQLTFNWKIRAHIVDDKVYFVRPRVQILFYLAGKSWSNSDVPDKLPCINVYAFRETQEVRTSCRLQGNPGLCVTELELLPAWFGPPLVVPGRKKTAEQWEGTSVQLYYTVQPLDGTNDCAMEDPRKGNAIHPGQDETLPSMQRIGSVYLFHTKESPKFTELRLDENILVQVPPSPVRQGDVVRFGIGVGSTTTVDQFTIRAKFQEGTNFLSLKPNTAGLWDVKQEMGTGRSAISVFCQKKSASSGNRVEGPFLEVMQIEFEVDNFSNGLSSHPVMWQVEYQGINTAPAEKISWVHASQKSLTGIVPLAEDAEILNTAILTGKPVAVPVKIVTVQEDGKTAEVNEALQCQSSDEDVIKVSETCDFVLVNGKEMRGRLNVLVNFTYLYLTSWLDITVWVPRLPLQIEVSDAELSQIKGWRVPIVSNKRPTRESDDEDDDEKKGKGCTLQYQHAVVRVLTHFVAEPSDTGGELSYMLSSDWQADITDLVTDFFKVEEPRIAKLQDGRILIGKELGITTIQVLSPLSDSILAEKTVTVLDDKVTITDLGLQLLAGLSLTLQPSTGSNRAILATTSAQELLHAPKQEAIISAWIQFSDGSVTPLNIYESKDFMLSATSLDEAIVTVYQDSFKWPVIIAEGEGQGPLVKVEMVISESCQKSKRKSVLAVGNASVRVKFAQGNVDEKGAGAESSKAVNNQETNGSDRKQHDLTASDIWKYNSAASDREEGAMRKITSTTKTMVTNRSEGGKLTEEEVQLQNIPLDFTNFPAQVDLPGGNPESDLSQAPRGLTDLEIGMYALLGVFCLAILVFLINCITFALKYRHKQVPATEQGNMNHSHDWVWLGNEAELLQHHMDLSPQQDECTTVIDRGEGYEESKFLLNGGCQKNIQGQIHRSAEPGCNGKDLKIEPLNSPTSKRKRVKFTSFATILPDDGGPYTNSILIGNEDDIKWVCQDMDLGQSTEIRSYMERLQDNL